MKSNINSVYPTVDPGTFRHQITLLSPTVSTDISGAVVTFAASTTVAWASIEYLRGAEIIHSGQDVTQTYIKVTSWWRPDFSFNSRIQLPSGSQFIIQAIENVHEMNVYMILMCLGTGANE